MSALPPRPVLRKAVVALLVPLVVAACATADPPAELPTGTSVDEMPTTPAPTESATTPPPPTESPTTFAPPDLSGRQIDCDAIAEPCDYGDDEYLDGLWDACAEGDGPACDRLYYDSAFDTRYEQFGNTCGDRDVFVPCP